MDVIGKYIIVPKHHPKSWKNRRRHFHDESDLAKATKLAQQYAAERGEDFLIVQVITEVSKPDAKDLPPQ